MVRTFKTMPCGALFMFGHIQRSVYIKREEKNGVALYRVVESPSQWRYRYVVERVEDVVVPHPGAQVQELPMEALFGVLPKIKYRG